MAKVIVGMSGGVDSAVTAYLMKLAGYEVIGVTLRVWTAANGMESRCCEIDDARIVADKLGIPYYALNCMIDFRDKVTEPFVASYLEGKTPNPCIECNRYIKWEHMLQTAKVMGADYIATGHYASVVQLPNGRYTVKKASHAQKDQTYMLYKLSQEQLAATLMPLGKLTKAEVRKIAEDAGIPVANKPDSEEICFVPEGTYGDYIEENAKTEIVTEGNFVDEQGNILGRHHGIYRYTPGQRKGLGIAMGHPIYVKEINAERNEVVISEEEALFTKEVLVEDINLQSIAEIPEGEKISCKARVRYHHEPAPATIEMAGENRIRILFEEPVRAAAPGQSAVFYDEDDNVIGGGIIVSKRDETTKD